MQKSQFERIGEAGRRRGVGVADERSQFKGDHRKHIQMRRSSLKSCYSSSMSEALLNGEKNNTRNITDFLFQALKNRFMNAKWM